MGGKQTKTVNNEPIYTKENLREMITLCVERAIRKIRNHEFAFEIDESAKDMLDGISEEDLVWIDRDYTGIFKDPTYLNPKKRKYLKVSN